MRRFRPFQETRRATAVFQDVASESQFDAVDPRVQVGFADAEVVVAGEQAPAVAGDADGGSTVEQGRVADAAPVDVSGDDEWFRRVQLAAVGEVEAGVGLARAGQPVDAEAGPKLSQVALGKGVDDVGVAGPQLVAAADSQILVTIEELGVDSESRPVVEQQTAGRVAQSVKVVAVLASQDRLPVRQLGVAEEFAERAVATVRMRKLWKFDRVQMAIGDDSTRDGERRRERHQQQLAGEITEAGRGHVVIVITVSVRVPRGLLLWFVSRWFAR